MNFVEAAGTDTSVVEVGIYAIDINMYGGTLDAYDLSPAGTLTIGVNGQASPSGDPNHIIIEPPQSSQNDDIIVGSGLTIQDPATLTDYTITGLVAQDDVRIKLKGGGSETVLDTGDFGPAALIFDGSASSRAGNTLNIPVFSPNFNATVFTDPAGDPEFQIAGAIVVFHDPIPADRIVVDDDAQSGATDSFDIADATALRGILEIFGNQAASEPVDDSFEVNATPADNLAITLIGGDGVNDYDIDHLGNNDGITIIGGFGGNFLTLDRTQSSSAFPDSVTLATTTTSSGPALSVTGPTTSVVAIGVSDITDNMYGGTLDVDDLATIAYMYITVTGEASIPGDRNHVVIEPPSGHAADNATVSYDNGLSIDDQATFAQYSITGFVAQDDVRIKLNGGGSETVNDLDALGPYGLIFDGSNRSGGGNTLKVPLVSPAFGATMTTDTAGDPQLQVGWGLLSFHGSTSTDRINVDDDVPASVTGVTTDTFDIDDSALQGTLDLVGDQSAAGRVADTFEVTNTPTIGLSTDLTGGTGPNTFEIVHGGVNRDIVVSGGSESNSLVLDRPQTSAADPDSMTLATAIRSAGSLVRPVNITGSDTFVQMSNVYNITVNMYGGTLDAEDLSLSGSFTIAVTGNASPAGDPNHIIIEPPLFGAHRTT